MGYHNSSAFIRYCTFTILHFIFSVIKLLDPYLKFVGKELRVTFCFVRFCFVKQTGLFSVFLPPVQIYVMKFFQMC